MNRLILFIVFLGLVFNVGSAQPNKIYLDHGITAGLGAIPLAVEEGAVYTGSVYVGYCFGLRVNLFEINHNMSLGLSAKPGFKIEFAASDFHGSIGGWDIPILLNLDIGAGATYIADPDFGFSFAIGLTPTYSGIWLSEATDKIAIAKSVKLGLRDIGFFSHTLYEFSIRYYQFSTDQSLLNDKNDKRLFMLTVSTTKFLFY